RPRPGPAGPGAHGRCCAHRPAAAGGQRDPRDDVHGIRRTLVALSEPAAPPSPHPGTISLGPGDVLVLRALGLGDALAGVAALRGVRRACPGRRLVLAAPTGIGGWLRDLGVVDAVIDATGLDEPLAVSGGGHPAVNLHGRGPRSHRRLQETNPAALVA